MVILHPHWKVCYTHNSFQSHTTYSPPDFGRVHLILQILKTIYPTGHKQYSEITKSFLGFCGVQIVAFAWGILICMYLWPPVSLALPWYKQGAGQGKVEWDETPTELADAFHRESAGPAAEVEAKIQEDLGHTVMEISWWRRTKNKMKAMWRERFGYEGGGGFGVGVGMGIWVGWGWAFRACLEIDDGDFYVLSLS